MSQAKIAYIMSRFPKLTETFVLYEILALEQLGLAVEIYPLLREHQTVTHHEAKRLVKRAHFHPFLSLPILWAQWHFIRRGPSDYFKLWLEVLHGTWGSLNFFVGAIGIFPRVVRFAHEMEKQEITHVHAHFATHPALAGLIIHRLTGIPFSFTAHGSDLHVERRMLDKKVEAAAFAVTISSYNKELMIKECGEETRKKIHVVHCGIDPDFFSRPNTRNGNGPFQIMCLASFEEVKGHKYLIQACQILHERGVDFCCHFLGDGPLRSKIEAQIAETGIQDKFRLHGPNPRPEIARMLAEVDVMVLASVPTRSGKREGIPVALMEAMASGLPVVASDISGIPELVQSGRTGLLVPPGNVALLADAIYALQENEEMRRCMGRAGREKVLCEFNQQNSAAQLSSLFLSGLKRAARAAGPRKTSSISRSLRDPSPAFVPHYSMSSLTTYLQPISRRMGLRLVIDRDPDHRRSIFLAGTGRSGGTWLCDILNQRNEYRLIFEPFHPKRAPWMKPFGERRYLRPEEEDPEFLELARSIVTGKVRHAWTERFNRRFVAHQRLIKEDYANLMLKWLHVNFPGMPLILLLRHPCAVALSFVTHDYKGAVMPLLEREKLVEDFLHPYVDEIRKARDVFERTLFLWCVEALVPLRQFRPGEVHVVFFENLVRNPESEIAGLLSHLGKSTDDRPLDLEKLRTPSLAARRATSAVWTGADPVESWQSKVSDAQRRRALEILSLFGLDAIYTDASLPRAEGVLEIMNDGRGAS